MTGSMRFLRMPVHQSEGRDEGGTLTDPVFDDEYYGRDQAGGKARTIGLVVGVVAGAIIAGTAAWFVFGPGGGAERGQTPLIVAEPEPFKVRPDNPGGLQVENQDKLVYGRIGDGARAPGVENILPSPETPKAPALPPVALAAQEAVPFVVSEPLGKAEPVAKQVLESVEETVVAAVPSTPAAPPSIDTPKVPVPSLPAVSEPTAAPLPRPLAAQEQTLESMVAVLSGDYLIQIVALRSQEAAEREWDRVSRRHASILGSYRPLIVKTDLGDRGIFYRLRAGPLASRNDAEQLCSALVAENVGCLVVRNE
jgi:cell division septation protein DedD